MSALCTCQWKQDIKQFQSSILTTHVIKCKRKGAMNISANMDSDEHKSWLKVAAAYRAQYVSGSRGCQRCLPHRSLAATLPELSSGVALAPLAQLGYSLRSAMV